MINTLVALPLCYNHSSCHKKSSLRQVKQIQIFAMNTGIERVIVAICLDVAHIVWKRYIQENCCKTLEIYFLGLYSLQIIAAENLLQSPPVISHQMFKCLTHKSDWHLISLYNVNPEYQSHKNMGNDHHLEKLSLVKKNSLCQPLRKCIENSMEDMHTDARVLRAKGSL